MKKIYTAMSLPLALLGGQRALEQDERLNIVYIMSDDHSAQAISAYGSILSPACSAPNIDRIGREGIRMGGGDRIVASFWLIFRVPAPILWLSCKSKHRIKTHQPANHE